MCQDAELLIRADQQFRCGRICTFYSFEGGVGKSMTLANVATALAGKNQKLLLIDWDLEAPGLDEFFAGYLVGSRQRTPGLVDLFEARQRGETLRWQDCLLQARPGTADPIDLLHAGRDDPDYLGRLRQICWDGPPEDGLGDFLEVLRQEWKETYDFIFIDSRTGLTDMGGICAVHLPDILVPLFTTTNQSIKGVADVARRAIAARAEMTVDRTQLLVVPVPTRDETNNEYLKAAQWRRRYAEALQPYMTSWMPKDVTAEHVFDRLRIPYVAFWSFGEELPVLKEDVTNPKTLAYSYELIARLLLARLDWSEID